MTAEQQTKREIGRSNDRELSDFDTDVEADELGNEMLRPEAEVLQHACKAKAV